MSPAAAPPLYDEFTESSIVRDIPLSLLDSSPSNPRKHFSDEQLQDLASDIGARGILSPLRVRPRAGGSFEIVFGERRYRAAQIACLTAAPCIISELSDLEVLELQIAENLQRADMTPLEEAQAFQRLQGLDPKYREVRALAAQVGKSVKTVRERLQLLTLIPAAREALDAGEITLGHAQLIVHLEAKAQPEALKECFYTLYGEKKDERELKPLKDFQQWFNESVILDPDGDVVPDLFPELAGEVAKARAAGGDIVRLSGLYAPPPKPRKGEAPVLGRYQFREAKPKDACAVTGVYVLGRDRGAIVTVCVDQDCPKHWPKTKTRTATRSTTTAAGASQKETKQQKDKRLAKEAKERRARELAEARLETVEQRAMDEFLAVVAKAQGDTITLLMRYVVCELLRGDVSADTFNKRFGTKAPSWQATPEHLKKLDPATLMAAMAFCVADAAQMNNDDIFKAFKVDVKRIDKEVAAEQAVQERAGGFDDDAPAKASAKKKPAAKAKAGKKR